MKLMHVHFHLSRVEKFKKKILHMFVSSLQVENKEKGRTQVGGVEYRQNLETHNQTKQNKIKSREKKRTVKRKLKYRKYKKKKKQS